MGVSTINRHFLSVWSIWLGGRDGWMIECAAMCCVLCWIVMHGIACTVCSDRTAWTWHGEQGIMRWQCLATPRSVMRDMWFSMLPSASSIPSSTASRIVVPPIVVVVVSSALLLLLLPAAWPRWCEASLLLIVALLLVISLLLVTALLVIALLEIAGWISGWWTWWRRWWPGT